MALRTFLAVLRRRAWLLAALLILAVVGSGVLSALTPRTYEATAELYFSVRSAASVDDLAQGASFTRDQMASFASLVETPTVLDAVAEEFDVNGGSKGLARRVDVDASDATVVLGLTVADRDPARAAAIANAVAERVVVVVEELSPAPAEGGPSGVEVSVVTPAVAPTAASSPNTVLNLAAGVVIGLALGVLAALAREALDTRVRTAEEAMALTRLPVLGTLGIDSSRQRRVVVEVDPHSPQAEAFRQLRTNLQFLDVGARAEAADGRTGHRAISVTSSLAAEGKSVVAVNLAVTLAETSARVLLVDADLRRPTVAGILGLEGGAGLTTVLLGQADVSDVVQEWGASGLHVLTSGALPPNPSELLGSAAMRRLLARLRDDYDYVVLDSAPLLPVADGAIVAGLVDGTILLANVTRVRRPQLAESIRNLRAVDAPVLGVVLNQVARDERTYRYRHDGGTAAPQATGETPAPDPSRTARGAEAATAGASPRP